MSWSVWVLIAVFGIPMTIAISAFLGEVWRALWSGPQVEKSYHLFLEKEFRVLKDRVVNLERSRPSDGERINEILCRLRYLEGKERAQKLLDEAHKYTAEYTEKYVYNTNARIQNQHLNDMRILGINSIVYPPKDLDIRGSWDLDQFEKDIIPKLIAEFHKSKCGKRRK
jgi:hypothetical protein